MYLQEDIIICKFIAPFFLSTEAIEIFLVLSLIPNYMKNKVIK